MNNNKIINQKYKTASKENGGYKVAGKILNESEFEKLKALMPNTNWILFKDFSGAKDNKSVLRINFNDAK